MKGYTVPLSVIPFFYLLVAFRAHELAWHEFFLDRKAESLTVVEIFASLEARHAEVEKVRRLVTLAREAEGWVFLSFLGHFSRVTQREGILFGHLEFNSGNVRWILSGYATFQAQTR